MKLYQVYIDDRYVGCVEAENLTFAGNEAIEKYPVKISSKLVIVPVEWH